MCVPDEIDGQRREMYDIERVIRNMQNGVIKLNTLLHQQQKTESELDQTNILTENDFIAGLRVSFNFEFKYSSCCLNGRQIKTCYA